MRAVELHVSATQPRDIGRVPGFERRHQLGNELGTTDDLIIDLAFLDPRLLGVGIALLLHDLVDLRGQRGWIPYDELRLASRMGSAHQPPGCCGCQDGRGLPGRL